MTTVTLIYLQRLTVSLSGFIMVFTGDLLQTVTVSVPTFEVGRLRTAGVIV